MIIIIKMYAATNCIYNYMQVLKDWHLAIFVCIIVCIDIGLIGGLSGYVAGRTEATFVRNKVHPTELIGVRKLNLT